MGSCCSSRIKAQTPTRNGLSGSKVSSASAPSTPRTEGEILQSANIKCFSFNELKTATRNFRPDSMVGEGGFGCVFKGWVDENSLKAAKPGIGLVIAVKRLNHEGLQGHKEWLLALFLNYDIVIAVKRLNHEGLQGHKEWLAEINYLGQLQHPNLVKLIGYCLEDEHRLLVYEFMPRGSLDNHLFRRASYFQPFSWAIRMKVALGAARGLAFLHSDQVKVIYRDFKASNILLDSDYNAKLSDFGLAKDGPEGDKSHVSTRVMGTFGYAAPEYMATGYLTTKSDVYSFGVVMLELLSGRRAIDKNRPSGEHNLVDWARPFLGSKRKVIQIFDPRIQGQYSLSAALRAVSIAIQCISTEPKHRPTMKEVVKSLEQLPESESPTKRRHQSLNHSPASSSPLHQLSMPPIRT